MTITFKKAIREGGFSSTHGDKDLLEHSPFKTAAISKHKHRLIKYSKIKRAIDLLMNLVEWSQSQTGRMEFNPEQFDLTEFIHDITLIFDDIAGQKGIVIKRELPPKAIVSAISGERSGHRTMKEFAQTHFSGKQ